MPGEFVAQEWHQPGAGRPIHQLRQPAPGTQVPEMQGVVYAWHCQHPAE